MSHNDMLTKPPAVEPKLSVLDAVALIVSIVIGAGIFETPSLVAAHASGRGAVLLSWSLGGGISLVGALCYAEMATTYPHPGGNYYYLQRAFGKGVAFLFAWARMTVIQTGSIALLAFVFGDYASQLFPLGTHSSALYAASAIALLTGLNVIGVQQGLRMQNWLAVAQILGLLLIVAVGIAFTAPTTPLGPVVSANRENWGLAMVFVLLTYSGWNEAAYISADLRNVGRNMSRSLFWSIAIITLLYLLLNIAYIQGLGLERMAQSKAVAADLMRRAAGEPGAAFISCLVAVTTLGSTNATIFTGARTNYALGQDFPLFAFLGRGRTRNSTPTNALAIQGAIALFLVLLGSMTRKGFETMVDYTAPVFWFFFLLTGVSLFVLRIREPTVIRPFRVPLYPLTPLLFCAVCGYMLQSSIAYTGFGTIVGVAVLLLGVLLLLLARRIHDKKHNLT